MNGPVNSQLVDLLNNITQTQILGALLVVIFLFKKLIKWAIILGVLFIVVLPYVENTAAFESLKVKLGF